MLEASGEAVGLMPGQMGDSNVGHLNIGAGRIVYQDVVRISRQIASGEFFRNPALMRAMNNAAGKALHLMGLLSDGGVHSLDTHLYALLQMAKASGVENVFVHAFLDGRDVPPTSAAVYLERLEKVAEIGIGKMASITGRYYAMDRDKRWDRIERAYRMLTLGEGSRLDLGRHWRICTGGAKPTSLFSQLGLPRRFPADEGETRSSSGTSGDRLEITHALLDDDFHGFPGDPRSAYTIVG